MAQPEEQLVFDGFVDLLKGFGSGEIGEKPIFLREKATPTEELLNLWERDWLAQAGVNRTVEMSLREGFTVKGPDGSPDKATQEAFEALDHDPYNPEGILRGALCLGRAAAGAVIVMLPDKARDITEPRGEKDGVRRLISVRWDHVKIERKDLDPNSPTLGEPVIYNITKPGFFTDLRIHASRVILCEGAVRKDPTPEVPWISVLEQAYGALANYGLSWEAISYLLREYSIMVLTMKGVHGALGTGKDTVAQNRMRAMSRGKSLFKTIFLDADGGEAAERIAVSFSDVPQLMQEMSRQITGAFRTPMTILFGISPAGLNATGTSDLTQYYDYIGSYRKQSVGPKAKNICEAISGHKCTIEFPSLWVPTVTEKADLQLKKSQTYRQYWEMSAISPLQILVSALHEEDIDLDASPEMIADLERRLAAGETDVPGLEKKSPEAPGNPFDVGATGAPDPTGATGGATGAPGPTGATS